MSTKTYTLIIGLMLLFSIVLFADYEVIIGESASLTQYNPYCPLRTNSGSANIILRSELPAGAGGEILAIYFFMDASSLNPWGYTKDIELYLSQTTNTEVTTSTPLTGGTLVYSHTGTYDNVGWIQYTLDSPFEWASQNLLITMNSELTYIPPGMPPDNYFRYSTAPGNLSGWVNRNDWIQPTTLTDGTLNGIDSQRPNIKIKFSGTIGISQQELPSEFGIEVYPNPFNSSCHISKPENTEGEIVDVNGRLIATISEDENRWIPDVSVGSGIYFLRVTNGQKELLTRVVYLK
jgi:hypothetical protein